MAAITETVLGVFAHVDTTVRALEELRAKGYHDLTVYTPIPVHEIEDVLERDRPVSRVRIFTLLGGLLGLASAWILTAWTSLQWGLFLGGKPPIGLPVSPPYVVIMFEMMVLFGGVATVIGMVVGGGCRACGPRRASTGASPTTASAWPCTARPRGARRCARSSAPPAPTRCAREVRLPPRAPVHRRRRRPHGRDHRVPLGPRHDADAAYRAGRARVLHARRRGAAGRGGRDPERAARRGGEGPESREGVAGVDRPRPRPLRDVLRAVPWSRGQGRGDGAGGDEVHPAAGPHERRSPAPAHRWLLAQLHRRRRRRHAGLRRSALLAGGVARRQLPALARTGRRRRPNGDQGGQAVTPVWGVLAAVGAVAFLVGARSPDAPATWSIYLVNLVFWSALAVTGPAIAAMMQLTEARWSPSVRRLAVTTVGFLPVSFVLLVVLFAGRDVLYSWVSHPIAVKAAWLNTKFFFGRTLVLAAILFIGRAHV